MMELIWHALTRPGLLGYTVLTALCWSTPCTTTVCNTVHYVLCMTNAYVSAPANTQSER
jgi:hypothetical protein